MKRATYLLTAAASLAMVVGYPAQGVTVISKAIEDLNHLQNDIPQNRYEMILNNTGVNPFRFAAVRFDADILGAAPGAPAFTDPSQWTLVSATVTLTEQAARNANNGSMSGRVGAYFLNTEENWEWTVANVDSVDNGNAGAGDVGQGWFGNSLARPGNFGGGPTGANNVDPRSNGLGNPLVSFWDGTAWAEHTFDPNNDAETVTIDLTAGGASLAEIQSILADWVAGKNAGLGFGAEFGNQSFWQSNDKPGGVSVGSTIDGDPTFSGVSTDDGTGPNGIGGNGPGAGTIFLTLEFVPVPEPSTYALMGLGMLALLALRRKK